MKKYVLTYGLLSGAVITIIMVITSMMCYNDPNFESNMMLGYASMLAAFSLIFLGIYKYRQDYLGGAITFGEAFKLGVYIALVSSSVYVAVWLVEYYVFIPDFMDKYAAHVLTEAQKEGATPVELAAKTADMGKYKEMYKNPVMVIMLTYTEVLPVGLAATILSAVILRRKRKNTGTPEN